jgi:hypothetical protein
VSAGNSQMSDDPTLLREPWRSCMSIEAATRDHLDSRARRVARALRAAPGTGPSSSSCRRPGVGCATVQGAPLPQVHAFLAQRCCATGRSREPVPILRRDPTPEPRRQPTTGVCVRSTHPPADGTCRRSWTWLSCPFYRLFAAKCTSYCFASSKPACLRACDSTHRQAAQAGSLGAVRRRASLGDARRIGDRYRQS